MKKLKYWLFVSYCMFYLARKYDSKICQWCFVSAGINRNCLLIDLWLHSGFSPQLAAPQPSGQKNSERILLYLSWSLIWKSIFALTSRIPCFCDAPNSVGRLTTDLILPEPLRTSPHLIAAIVLKSVPISTDDGCHYRLIHPFSSNFQFHLNQVLRRAFQLTRRELPVCQAHHQNWMRSVGVYSFMAWGDDYPCSKSISLKIL